MSDLVGVTFEFANGPGNNADADQVNQNFDDLVGWLNTRFGNASPGQLPIASTLGVLTPRAITGDIGISPSGVATIANKPVPQQVVQTSGMTPTSTSYTDIPGVSAIVTPSVPSVAVVIGNFTLNVGTSGHNLANGGVCTLNVDGVDRTDPANINLVAGSNPTVSATSIVASVSRTWIVSLTAASHTLKMRAHKTDVNPDDSFSVANSTMTYTVFPT